jgi:hypothetical protein
VDAAFDILLEQIEAEIDLVNRGGARALESRDYDTARATLERASLLTAFRDRTAALWREWTTLAAPQAAVEETTDEQTQRRDLGRLRRGLRTPEEAFNRPILQVLVELGGRAPMGHVLDRVGQLMRGVLRDVDHQPLASDPDLPRWRNTAQWARNSMVREGLLRNDSPRGIWEISDAGRQSLQGVAPDAESFMENTHPFRHDLHDIPIVFAHNSTLRGLPQPTHFRPEGQTDSEQCLCLLLSWMQEEEVPVSDFRRIEGWLRELNNHGSMNLLFSNGTELLAYRDRDGYNGLCFTYREAPFQAITLQDEDWTVDLSEEKRPSERGFVIATRPLTSECLTDLKEGDLLVIRAGRAVYGDPRV